MPAPVLIYRRNAQNTTELQDDIQGKTNAFTSDYNLLEMPRNRWAGGVVAAFASAAAFCAYFWVRGVKAPPQPGAALLPASAQILLQPFRKDSIDLTVAGRGEMQYRIAMREGATLVYAWSASGGPLRCEFANQRPDEARSNHGAFVAQSSGWYRWRWSNPGGNAAVIHLKLSGYYERPVVP
jgi:hypothetical protein